MNFLCDNFHEFRNDDKFSDDVMDFYDVIAILL